MKLINPRGGIAPWVGAAGLLAAGTILGGVLFGSLSASAATSSSGSTSSTAVGGAGTEQPRANYPAHGTAAHEALEQPVTGANAAKAQAAAVKAVGSGQAGAVTTDVSGNGYEVTVTKSDGSQVEVHLDQSFNLGGHGRLEAERPPTGPPHAGPVGGSDRGYGWARAVYSPHLSTACCRSIAATTSRGNPTV